MKEISKNLKEIQLVFQYFPTFLVALCLHNTLDDPPSKFHVLFEFSIVFSIFSNFSYDFINFTFVAGSPLYERLLTPGFRRSTANFDMNFEWILSISNIFDKILVKNDRRARLYADSLGSEYFFTVFNRKKST